MTTTLSEVPEATGDLLKLVDEGASHKELSDKATQMRAAARSREDERLRRARVHTNRHFRWRQDENGGIRGEFLCDDVAWARVGPRLEAEARRRWKAAGNANGGGDSLEAYRLDAFIDMMGGGLRGAVGGRGARPRARVAATTTGMRTRTTATTLAGAVPGAVLVPAEAVPAPLVVRATAPRAP